MDISQRRVLKSLRWHPPGNVSLFFIDRRFDCATVLNKTYF